MIGGLAGGSFKSAAIGAGTGGAGGYYVAKQKQYYARLRVQRGSALCGSRRRGRSGGHVVAALGEQIAFDRLRAKLR